MNSDTNRDLQAKIATAANTSTESESAKRDRNTHLLLVAWSVLLEKRRQRATEPPTEKSIEDLTDRRMRE